MQSCALRFVLPACIACAAPAPAWAVDKGNPPLDCVAMLASAAAGASTDRFLREWCQRNAAGQSDASAAPDAMPATPAEDNAASRLPPGYHCHILAMGKRLCHSAWNDQADTIR